MVKYRCKLCWEDLEWEEMGDHFYGYHKVDYKAGCAQLFWDIGSNGELIK